MIIVKVTVMLILITVLSTCAGKLWASSNPREYTRIYLSGDFPKWVYLYALLVILSAVGILASAIYLLFIR